MSEDVHSSDNLLKLREVPVTGTIEDGKITDPRGDEERLEEDWNEQTSQVPVNEAKRPWCDRLREFVTTAVKAIRKGYADATAPKTKAQKAWEIIEKLITIAAGWFGLKKL